MTNAEYIRWLKLLDEELTFDTLVDGKDEMDMHEMIWELCEKLEQEPKSVLYSGDGYADGYMVYDMAECPTCGYEYEEDDKDWKEPFCPHCGQALKWESEE